MPWRILVPEVIAMEALIQDVVVVGGGAAGLSACSSWAGRGGAAPGAMPVCLATPPLLSAGSDEVTTMDPKGEQAAFVYTTYIKGSPERAWQGLTDPELMKRYWRHQTAGPAAGRAALIRACTSARPLASIA